MNLLLRGLSLNDQPLSQPLLGRFDQRGGSIGRSDNVTLTLPDPQRLISRVQAKITFSEGGYWLVDLGRANPILHNDQALGPGARVRLNANDDLLIGRYRLAVEYETDDSTATILRRRTTTEPRPMHDNDAVRARAAALSNPFADLMGPSPPAQQAAPAADPFASLLRSGPPAPLASPVPAPPRPLPSARAAVDADPFADLLRAPSPAPSGYARLPDDFDPFAEPTSKPAPPPEFNASDPLAMIGSAAPSIDDVFGLNKPSASDPLADFLAPGQRAAASAPPQIPLDPLLALSAAPAAREQAARAAQPAAPDHVAELAGAYRPPNVRTPAAAPAAMSPPVLSPTPPVLPGESAAAPHSPYTADDIWRGFLDGVGVDIPLPRGVTPELMRTVGGMLRVAVDGLLQLIAMRATAKNALRAEMTVIQVRENNPLKFSPDAQAALLQLLQPPGRGFLPGKVAIREAMNDLQSHQIGVMAGMRAALAGVLQRFEPGLLEGRLAETTMLDAILPMKRKAKLWELFLQQHAAIRNEAEDGFHELFGKAFMAAYEEQVARLEAAQRKAGTPR